ncbi:hypothetical protein P3X46_000882 [Hevea brasiliensis]|uniref:CCHC-type domain-containing protein n=1 Tax=Hevea brasiliensis TaxID=3981 RepID=A0ABQ9NCS0_HEVBR|nr:hypothetical protein P3X46_000882 [Hevea brasiliensis]
MDGDGKESKDNSLSSSDFSVDTSGKIPKIILSERAREHLIRPWKYAVVVRLLGRSIGYKSLCSQIESLWRPNGEYKVIDLSNDYFLVNLSQKFDYVHVLLEGPRWFGCGFLICPSNCTTKEYLRLIVELIGKHLRLIVELIGKLVHIDCNTEEACRGKFARIAIKVDLNKPLLAKFDIEGRVQNVEYKGLYNICFSCGCFGHNKDSCPERIPSSHEAMPVEGSVQAGSHDGGQTSKVMEEEFGEWMIAPTRRRRPKQGKEAEKRLGSNGDNLGNGIKGSRLDALSNYVQEE